MFARSVAVQADPNRIDEGIEYVRGPVTDTLRAQQGSQGLSMLVDRDSGRVIVVSGWASEAAMHASESALAPLRTAWPGLSKERPPQVDLWEMAVMHRVRRPEDGYSIRSTWLTLDPADVTSAIETFRSTAVPAIETQSGFVSTTLLVNREKGEAISSVVFDSRQEMERTREQSAKIRAAATEKAHATVREVAEFELAISGLVPAPD